MTKRRAALHLSSPYLGMDRAVDSAFLIPLVGPKAHDSSYVRKTREVSKRGCRLAHVGFVLLGRFARRRHIIPTGVESKASLTHYLLFSRGWVERRPDWSPAALPGACNVTGRSG
jgi:hypothetical protein